MTALRGPPALIQAGGAGFDCFALSGHFLPSCRLRIAKTLILCVRKTTPFKKDHHPLYFSGFSQWGLKLYSQWSFKLRPLCFFPFTAT